MAQERQATKWLLEFTNHIYTCLQMIASAYKKGLWEDNKYISKEIEADYLNL